MKKIFKIGSFILAASLLLWGCKKDEIKTIYNGGKAPVLSASQSAVNMTATDSTKTVLTLSWTDPSYSFSTGRTSLDVTHTVEIDKAGNNFANAQTISSANMLQESQTGTFILPLTGAELNKITQDLELAPGQAHNLEVRVSSSLYVASTKLSSNVINLAVTPYSTRPQPKYPVPDNLYIIGGATPAGWGNPVPVPAQQLTKIDDNTFGTIIRLTGGEKYLFIPVNGSWDAKYAVGDNSKPEAKTGTDFTVNSGQDIPAPDQTGYYKIIVDFITGKYSVEPFDVSTIPANLFIVGGATPGGWGNPVPVPAQQFTKVNTFTFEITINLKAGEKYLFLPENGSWDHKFAVANNTVPEAKTGTAFTVDSGQDIPAPDETGNYKITVNFLTNTYTVTKV